VCRKAMLGAWSVKFIENPRDGPQYVKVTCYYCLSLSRRHLEIMTVNQVAKLLRTFRGTGRLIRVFNAGTFLSQLNSTILSHATSLCRILIISF
jgi:hypothetical protein